MGNYFNNRRNYSAIRIRTCLTQLKINREGFVQHSHFGYAIYVCCGITPHDIGIYEIHFSIEGQ